MQESHAFVHREPGRAIGHPAGLSLEKGFLQAERSRGTVAAKCCAFPPTEAFVGGRSVESVLQ